MIFEEYILAKTNGQFFYMQKFIAYSYLFFTHYAATVQQRYFRIGPPMKDALNRRFSKRANAHVTRIECCPKQANPD
jgi:hypothetical protein